MTLRVTVRAALLVPHDRGATQPDGRLPHGRGLRRPRLVVDRRIERARVVAVRRAVWLARHRTRARRRRRRRAAVRGQVARAVRRRRAAVRRGRRGGAVRVVRRWCRGRAVGRRPEIGRRVIRWQGGEVPGGRVVRVALRAMSLPGGTLPGIAARLVGGVPGAAEPPVRPVVAALAHPTILPHRGAPREGPRRRWWPIVHNGQVTTPDEPRETTLDLAEPFTPPPTGHPGADPRARDGPRAGRGARGRRRRRPRRVPRAMRPARSASTWRPRARPSSSSRTCSLRRCPATSAGTGRSASPGPPTARSRTVDEVVLLPGDGALLAPAWVPWEERVRPGDLSPGDLLPPRPQDPRLVPGLYPLRRSGRRAGRIRTRSRPRAGPVPRGPAGRRRALAVRRPRARTRPWPGRPRPPAARAGSSLPLAGSLQAGFGVCGNELTDTDGQVVSVEYGCGAHSQAEAAPQPRRASCPRSSTTTATRSSRPRRRRGLRGCGPSGGGGP